jgi:hypothetical protein
MVMVALALIALIGFVGLVADLGRLMVTKTELQNAADACALAAARELTGDTAALVRAENAGIAVGQRHWVNFQSAAVSVPPADVTFSANLSPDSAYLSRLNGADPATARYAMCTLSRGGIVPWFMQTLGFGTQSVSSMAVATLGHAQTSCAVPVGICQQGASPSAANNYGLVVGNWYSGLSNGATGSYGWVDFSPGQPTPGCGPSNGASELSCLLEGEGQCNLPPAGTQVGQQGNPASLAVGWNSRFGMYKNGNGNPKPDTSPPDFSGYSYDTGNWPAGKNAYSDFVNVKRANHLAYQGALGYNKNSTSAELAVQGRDRRLVLAPIVNCTTLYGSNPQTYPVKDYACILLLNPIKFQSDVVYEFRGLASATTNCASYGLAGNTGNGALVSTLVQ